MDGLNAVVKLIYSVNTEESIDLTLEADDESFVI